MRIYDAAKYLLKESLDTDKFIIYSLYSENNFAWLRSNIYKSLIYLGLIMKISIPKNLHGISISKERILNFIGAHPRLITVMAGIGISFTFSFTGKTLIHEILQPAYAFFAVFCSGCGASEFSPGHEATSPGDAKDFAPGIDAKSAGDASNIAPGQVFKKGLH